MAMAAVKHDLDQRGREDRDGLHACVERVWPGCARPGRFPGNRAGV